MQQRVQQLQLLYWTYFLMNRTMSFIDKKKMLLNIKGK